MKRMLPAFGYIDLRHLQTNDLDFSRHEQTPVPSTSSLLTNYGHSYSEPVRERRRVRIGTADFVSELKERNFPSAETIIQHVPGNEIDIEYLMYHGFEVPIICKTRDISGMILPSKYFTVDDLEKFIGTEHEVDVIDVAKQTSIRMKFGKYVEYYNTPCKERLNILDLINLEFSETRLSEMVQAPYAVEELDWFTYVLPRHLPDDNEFKKLKTKKYCLMGVQGSYIDFCIDYGGSSMWYHLFKGQQVFYLVRPTPANLSIYENWMNSATQSETFFGDQTTRERLEEIPKSIEAEKVLKDLCKEVEYAEQHLVPESIEIKRTEKEN